MGGRITYAPHGLPPSRLRRRDRIARHRRLDSRHRRWRQSLSRPAQHAAALPPGHRRLAHGSDGSGRRRRCRGRLQHGRPAGRPGAAHRPAHDRPRRHHDGGIPGPAVPRHHVARDRRRQRDPAVHGRRAAESSGGRRRLHGPRVPRSADDLVRHPRSADVPPHPGRRARQRHRGGAGRLLEVDGAAVAHGVRGGRLDRRHLQGPAHRQGDQGVRDPLLHEQGHPDRADRPGCAAGPPRSDRGPDRGRARPPALHRQDRRRGPPGDRGLPARHRQARRASAPSAVSASSSPSRTSSRWAGSTACPP